MQGSAAARRFAPTALMLGNIVTGCAVLAPAGMLKELSAGLDVSISSAGLLITCHRVADQSLRSAQSAGGDPCGDGAHQSPLCLCD
jgi:hypothetical protein